ncbi:MAG TPA: hypothetical protein VKM54_02410 [Myxococcota bacterium]|nr:hypothetical protein [Myxococcota bacterium]
MSQKPLKETLGNAAPDRIGRKRVLCALVERHVRQPGIAHGLGPELAQGLVRVAVSRSRVREERSAAQALVSRHVPLDPVREHLTDRKTLGLAGLCAADR